MRWLLSIAVVVMLSHCGTVSDYDPNTGSNSSFMGTQGGAGVQAPIWSTDPNKKTVTNSNLMQQ